MYVTYATIVLTILTDVVILIPVDTGRKLNVHKTFRRRPGRLLNVLYTFNLRPVTRGELSYSDQDFSKDIAILVKTDNIIVV